MDAAHNDESGSSIERIRRLWPLYIVAILLAVAASCWRVPTTYNVTTNTEAVVFRTRAEPSSRWVLDSLLVSADYGESRVFTGSLALLDSVEVTLERVANGPLYIRFEALSSRTSVGMLFNAIDDPIGKAPKILEVEVTDLKERANSGRTLVFPLHGDVQLQQPFGFETSGSPALLRSGKIAMLGRSFVFPGVFEAGSHDLDPGDQVGIGRAQSAAIGFIAANEAPALTVAYRVVARNVEIVRPGGQAFPVFVSPRERIVKDLRIQYAWLTLLTIAGLAKYLKPRDKEKSS